MKSILGIGKTFIAFKCLSTLPNNTKVLFLSESSVREDTVREDAEFFEKVYGYNPLKEYDIKFSLYQSAARRTLNDYFPSQKDVFIIMDEVQDILSDKRSLFLTKSNLKGIKLLGLSATIERKKKYIIQGEEITKVDFLNRYCPIIYSYTINEAFNDNNTKKLRFFILSHQLDTLKNIKTGSKSKQWVSSEKLMYEYLDREFKKSLFLPHSSNKEFRIRMCASKRAKFLYSLPSKIPVIKDLITHLIGKTIVFGLDNKSLVEICPTAIIQENINLKQDLENFKNGNTQLTCSNKILRQGENIKNLQNTVFHSYYSTWPAFTQILGRQRKGEDVGNIIILITENTQEQAWFKSMTEQINADFIYCSTLKDLVQKL